MNNRNQELVSKEIVEKITTDKNHFNKFKQCILMTAYICRHQSDDDKKALLKIFVKELQSILINTPSISTETKQFFQANHQIIYQFLSNLIGSDNCEPYINQELYAKRIDNKVHSILTNKDEKLASMKLSNDRLARVHQTIEQIGMVRDEIYRKKEEVKERDYMNNEARHLIPLLIYLAIAYGISQYNFSGTKNVELFSPITRIDDQRVGFFVAMLAISLALYELSHIAGTSFRQEKVKILFESKDKADQFEKEMLNFKIFSESFQQNITDVRTQMPFDYTTLSSVAPVPAQVSGSDVNNNIVRKEKDGKQEIEDYNEAYDQHDRAYTPKTKKKTKPPSTIAPHSMFRSIDESKKETKSIWVLKNGIKISLDTVPIVGGTREFNQLIEGKYEAFLDEELDKIAPEFLPFFQKLMSEEAVWTPGAAKGTTGLHTLKSNKLLSLKINHDPRVLGTIVGYKKDDPTVKLYYFWKYVSTHSELDRLMENINQTIKSVEDKVLNHYAKVPSLSPSPT